MLRHVPLVVLTTTTLWATACGGAADPPPLLDATSFQQGYDQLGTMADRAAEGDVDGANEAFTEVLPLASLAGEALANDPEEVIMRAALVDAVVSIEQELKDQRRPDVLARYARDARGALADVAEALGVERPAEP